MTKTQVKAIGIFPTYQQAVQALKALQKTQFPMNQISLISANRLSETIDSQNNQFSSNEARATVTPAVGALKGAIVGGTTGGLIALITSLTVLVLPGVGAALAVETLLLSLLGSAASATAGGVLGALRGWFLPEEAAQFYRDLVLQGDYLVTIEGTESDIRLAQSIFSRYRIEQWRIYNLESD